MNARDRAILYARNLLLEGNFLVLDTETTGLDSRAEVIELALIDPHGEPVINTRCRNIRNISADASRVHGIYEADLVDAPLFDAVACRLKSVIDAHNNPTIIIYNAEYDSRLLVQSALLNQTTIPPLKTFCLMLSYAEFYGEWNHFRASYAWQKLVKAVSQVGLDPSEYQAHSALGDCRMTLDLLNEMAATPLSTENAEVAHG